ncbi:hypothetical protein CK218_12720 [Mesorhizobium sp. WSM3879]|uniref:hypothetical protein n=1 Tax=Mesorhizobium sp. WSM3879 TaxID=2029406 RepID=UPI000BAFDB4E|nr:hypothetical protein [Mesorhizobium sp. WSM3879]PBB81225.1 hypothetical protein CK218_12720 [Mesorhizobium sp. WSM3879]
MLLQSVERTSELGSLGERLAAECLARAGFSEVVNLNCVRRHYPFADLIGVRNNVRFLIGVKTRNEMRRGRLKMNEAYNLVLVSNPKNQALKLQGRTVEEITRMALEEVHQLARAERAKPAWITVPINATTATFSAYFGLLDDLGCRRSVPMTYEARRRYLALAEERHDDRIAPHLLN